jgi:hypothetical protein
MTNYIRTQIYWAAGSLLNFPFSVLGIYKLKAQLLRKKSYEITIKIKLNKKNNITCALNCNYRIAATLYTSETWFIAGIYS